jgi:DNA polymerase elongation subunit (family B)
VSCLQATERSLLTALLARLQALDADVLVGHNLGAFDLAVLLARMQVHKVSCWLLLDSWTVTALAGHGMQRSQNQQVMDCSSHFLGACT